MLPDLSNRLFLPFKQKQANIVENCTLLLEDLALFGFPLYPSACPCFNYNSKIVLSPTPCVPEIGYLSHNLFYNMLR